MSLVKKFYISQLLQKGIVLVLDEAYHYFGSISYIKKVNKLKNLVVMRTFSKAWGLPGIRLGYMATNPQLCVTFLSVDL